MFTLTSAQKNALLASSVREKTVWKIYFGTSNRHNRLYDAGFQVDQLDSSSWSVSDGAIYNSGGKFGYGYAKLFDDGTLVQNLSKKNNDFGYEFLSRRLDRVSAGSRYVLSFYHKSTTSGNVIASIKSPTLGTLHTYSLVFFASTDWSREEFDFTLSLGATATSMPDDLYVEFSFIGGVSDFVSISCPMLEDDVQFADLTWRGTASAFITLEPNLCYETDGGTDLSDSVMRYSVESAAAFGHDGQLDLSAGSFTFFAEDYGSIVGPIRADGLGDFRKGNRVIAYNEHYDTSGVLFRIPIGVFFVESASQNLGSGEITVELSSYWSDLAKKNSSEYITTSTSSEDVISMLMFYAGYNVEQPSVEQFVEFNGNYVSYPFVVIPKDERYLDAIHKLAIANTKSVYVDQDGKLIFRDLVNTATVTAEESDYDNTIDLSPEIMDAVSHVVVKADPYIISEATGERVDPTRNPGNVDQGLIDSGNPYAYELYADAIANPADITLGNNPDLDGLFDGVTISVSTDPYALANGNGTQGRNEQDCPYIEIDVGQGANPVAGMHIWFDSRANENYLFKVAASLDNQRWWYLAGDRNTYEQSNPNGFENAKTAVAGFGMQYVRYLRIYMNGAIGLNYNRLFDIQIFKSSFVSTLIGSGGTGSGTVEVSDSGITIWKNQTHTDANVTFRAKARDGHVQIRGVGISNEANPILHIQGTASSGFKIYDGGVKAYNQAGDTKFHIDTNTGDVTIDGVINASSGLIAGWCVSPTCLCKNDAIISSTGYASFGTGTNIAIISAVDPDYRFWAGHTAGVSAPFSVSKTGALVATSATISGTICASAGCVGGFCLSTVNGLYSGTGATRVQMKSGSGFWAGHDTQTSSPFYVTAAGVLCSTSGTVGGWTLGTDKLCAGSASICSTGVAVFGTSNDVAIISAADSTYRFWAGHATAASAPFSVTKEGEIKATSGTIGGWTIGSNCISAAGFILDCTGVAKANYEAGVSGWCLSADGSAEFQDITLRGDFPEGTIAGFTFNQTDGFYVGSGATRFQMKPTVGLWMGSTAVEDAPFRVCVNGCTYIAKLGVGMTASCTLDVLGASRICGALCVANGNITTTCCICATGNILTAGMVCSSGAGCSYFAGNVGIGTTSPVSKLHIHGNYNNTGNGGFTLDATDTGDPERYVLRINPFVVGGGKVGYQFQTKSAFGGTNVPLTFDNAGNVGIGTTSPGKKLDVLGDSRFCGSLCVAGNNILTNCRVGIGTDTPASRLSNLSSNICDDYSGASTDGIIWCVHAPDRYAVAIQNDYIYGGGLLIKAGNDKHVVRRLLHVANSDNTSRLIVRGNGYVGIGTNSPECFLDVVGNSRVCGCISASNNILTSCCICSSGNLVTSCCVSASGNILTTCCICAAGYVQSSRVGVGMAATCILDVTGNARICGTLSVDGSLHVCNSACSTLLGTQIKIGHPSGAFEYGLIDFAGAPSTNFYVSYTNTNVARWKQCFVSQTMGWYNNAGCPVFYANNSGHVGIGTTTISCILDVLGNARVCGCVCTSGEVKTSAGFCSVGTTICNCLCAPLYIVSSGLGANPVLSLQNGSGYVATVIRLVASFGELSCSYLAFDYFGGNFGCCSHGMNYVSGRTSAGNHWFRNGNCDIQMVIRHGGCVGIGTCEPACKLDVVGNSRVCGCLCISSNILTGGTLCSSSTGNNYLAGTLGVGGSCCSNRLYIKSAGTNTVPVLVRNFGNTVDLACLLETSGGHIALSMRGCDGCHDVQLSSGSDNSFICRGNFGLGICNPSCKLDVVGDSRFCGNVGISCCLGVGVINPSYTLDVIGSGRFCCHVIAPSISSNCFTSGLTGWCINQLGNSELNNAVIRGELHSATFVYDEVSAVGGNLFVANSATILADFTTAPTTFVVCTKDPVSGHAKQFDINDVLRVKTFNGTSVYDIWGTVSAYCDCLDHYQYTLCMKSGSCGIVIPAGSTIVSYGAVCTGGGIMMVGAGTCVCNNPYIDIFANGSEPWTGDPVCGIIPQVRLGKLDGIVGYCGYGLWTNCGHIVGGVVKSNNWSACSGSCFDLSTGNLTLGGWTNPALCFDSCTGDLTISGEMAACTGCIAGWCITATDLCQANMRINSGGYISAGLTPPTAYGDNCGIWVGYCNAAKMSLYSDCCNYLQWDGCKLLVKAANFTLDANGCITASNATLSGTICSCLGSIGGFCIQSNMLCSSPSAGCSVGISSCCTGGAVVVWAGCSTLASAPFRVTNQGCLFASNANISGTVCASAGCVAGWSITTCKLCAGNVGIDSCTTAGTVSFYAGNATPDSAPFRVTNQGCLTASNAVITGTVCASAGCVGGFSLTTADGLYSGSGATRVQMKSGAGFWAGADAQASAPFYVTQAGVLCAYCGTVGGFTLGSTILCSCPAAGCAVGMSACTTNDAIAFWAGCSTLASAPFRVTNRGCLTASNAVITGTVCASAGCIGGWIIQSGRICSTCITIGQNASNYGNGLTVYSSGGTYAFQAMANCIYDGTSLICHSGVIVRNLAGTQVFRATSCATAASGECLFIGGWNFTNNCLYSGNLKLDSAGSIQGSYAATTGWCLGADGTMKFGGSSAPKLSWDGTTLSVTGNVTITGGSTTLDSIGDGSTYKRVTANEKTGAGYGYGAITTNGTVYTINRQDTRWENYAPSWYSRGTTNEFKASASIGVTGGDTYGSLTTEKPWTDSSGGYAVQTYQDRYGVWERRAPGADAAWGSWYKITDETGTLKNRVIPIVATSPSGSGLYLGCDYMGYYDGSAWKTYMDKTGKFYLTGASGGLAWDGSGLTVCGTVCSCCGCIGGWSIQENRISSSCITVGQNEHGLGTGITIKSSIGGYLTQIMANCILDGSAFICHSGIIIRNVAGIPVFRATYCATAATGDCLFIGGTCFTSSCLYSSNYSAGSAGYALKSDGSADFQNVTVRGHVCATSGCFNGTLSAGIVNTTNLTVLATNLLNPVTQTGNVRGWGLIREDGTGSSSYISYDATECALEITNNGNVGVRSQSWMIDHNKIYRISMKIKKSSAHGSFYVGASQWATATLGTESNGNQQGTITFIPYSTTRVAGAPADNVYFASGYGSTSYECFIVYLIGANRSVNDAPIHCGGQIPFAHLNATAKHVSIRLLNWSNISPTSMFVKDISAVDVGQGMIVSENITSGQIVGKDFRTATNAGNGTVSGIRLYSSALEGWNGAAKTFCLNASNGDLFLAGCMVSKGVFYREDTSTRFITGSATNTFIGDNAGNTTLTGLYNTGIGVAALGKITTGLYNLAIGMKAGCGITTGCYNHLIGYGSGCYLTTGFLNVGIGLDSLMCLSTGLDNIGIGGYATLRRATTASYNIAIGGYISDTCDYTGSHSIIIGRTSHRCATSGNLNIIVGSFSYNGVATGTDNVVIGHCSIRVATSAKLNVGIGNGVFAALTTGVCNVTVGGLSAVSSGGYNASVGIASLGDLTTGCNNTAVGYYSMRWSTTGGGNTAIGAYSGLNITTGAWNTAIGTCSIGMSGAATGFCNTAVGLGSLGYLTTGCYNTAVGAGSAEQLTTGCSNTVAGYGAGQYVTTGGENTFIGHMAGSGQDFKAISGCSNTAVGYYSLSFLINGSGNTAIGKYSSYATRYACNNTSVGESSLFLNMCGNNNSAVGKNAMCCNCTGNNNTAIGANALCAIKSGCSNAAVGTFSLSSLTSGCNNTAVGYGALCSLTTGSDLVAVGHSSLSKNTSGVNNVAYGSNSLLSNTTGSNNIAIGLNALCLNTTANYSIAIGENALAKMTTGFGEGTLSFNIAIGGSALCSNTSGYTNIAIGYSALTDNTTGCANVAIGSSSLENNTSGCNNIGIGSNTLPSNTGGCQNMAIGAYALQRNSTGSDNLAIGAAALSYVTSGSGNIGIGNSAGINIATASNTIAINHAGTNNSNYIYMGNSSVAVACIKVGWSVYSDRRGKDNISEIKNGLDIVRMLNPVSFTLKDSNRNRINFGFIAQEVSCLFSPDSYEIVGHDKLEDSYTIRYQDFISPAISAIKTIDSCVTNNSNCIIQQSNTICCQQKCINEMNKCMSEMESRLSCIEKMLSGEC